MMKLSRLHVTGLALLSAAPVTLFANAFSEAAPHLDTDGSFITFMDFEGDGQEIGTTLNELYGMALAANPQMAPIPLDFNALFDTLGFGSIKSVGMSSKELEDGLVRNLSVTVLNGEPAGLMGLYGLEPAPFRAARLAPADATTVMSGQLKTDVLRDTIVALVTQIMGPLGQGMSQQYLAMPIPGTDVTATEAIDALSGPMDFIMYQRILEDGQPDIKIWTSILGAGNLLPRLKPLAEMMPITFTEDASGLEADFSALLQGAPMGLVLKVPAGSDALVILTDRTWASTIGQAGNRLVDQESYKRVASQLPETAAMYAYSSGFDAQQLLAALSQEPEVAPYLPLIEKAVELFAGDFLAPNAKAIYREDNVLITQQYGDFSFKQALGMIPAGIGLTAAMAIPAFQKVKQTSQEKTVTNNLRQLASAAQQHMLETGATSVTYSELVGPDKWITEIEPVAGESYEDLVFTIETTEISVTLPDGRIVSYTF